MSPEQARGESVDHRTDIWSLGVLIYEMLTGARPFKGEFDSALIYSITNTEYEPITKARKDIPSQLVNIVERCLEKDPSKRYQNAADVIVELKRCRLEPAQTMASRRRFITYSLLAFAILAVAITVYSVFFKSGEPIQVVKTSIAILPFKNLSDSKEDEYFADGITEDLITQLSKIADLKVISRTSVMQYKTTSKNVREIGKDLDVGSVLEGSVRRAGSQLRIVAQLIDAHNEGHLWAETYDKEMTQIFAVQSDCRSRDRESAQS